MSVKKCKNLIGPTIYQELHKRRKIPIKNILFIAEYVTNGFNATAAYKKALGRRTITHNTAATQGTAMFKRREILDAVEYIISMWLGEKRVKLEREIIDILFARAFYDPADFINADGSPKFEKLEDVPEKWRYAIDGIESKYYGRDADVKITSIKLADREKAAEKLAKYIELYKSAENPQGGIVLTDDAVRRLDYVFRSRSGNGNGNGKKHISGVTTIIEGDNAN